MTKDYKFPTEKKSDSMEDLLRKLKLEIARIEGFRRECERVLYGKDAERDIND